MQNALLITAIGMGLVFVALLLVWGMMEVLMHYTRDRKGELSVAVEEKTTGKQAPDRRKIAALGVAVAVQQRRYQAALLAVEIALKEEETQAQGLSQNGTMQGSQWQPVMRALQREERIRLFNRNPRGWRK